MNKLSLRARTVGERGPLALINSDKGNPHFFYNDRPFSFNDCFVEISFRGRENILIISGRELEALLVRRSN